MKHPTILVLSLPTRRYDQTLHYYHAEFCSVVQFLKTRFPDSDVTALPAGLRNDPDRTVIKVLLECKPHFVLLWSRVWESPAAKTWGGLVREMFPESRILVWGDGPLFIPQYFSRAPFDGFVSRGDAELVLADAIEAMSNGKSPTHGMAFRTESGWRDPGQARWLGGEKWPFPDLSVIRFEDYDQAREGRGKDTTDLSFDVSRGCPVGCPWCVDPLKGGLRDRRRPVRNTVDFMRSSLGRYDQFQLHGPVFTADRHWIGEFVRQLRRSGEPIPFKAVTLARHLTDESLVAELASVGMRAIGFGIETLTARTGPVLTRKLPADSELDRIAGILRRQGIEGKAYTQLGLPGQRREDIFYTHDRLLNLGFTVRPTGSTPFHLLRGMPVDQLDSLDLSAWDRKSFYDPNCGLSRQEFFQLLVDPAEFNAAATLEPEREVA